MQVLADATKFTTSEPVVQKYKLWAEIFIDVFLTALFSTGFIMWSQTMVEAGGVICVPTYGSSRDFSLSEARYINSRCQLDIAIRILLFYPYYVLISFGVMFIAHIIWSKLPSVIARLDTYYHLFSQISKLNPVYSYDSIKNKVLPDFYHNQHDPNTVKKLQEKLVFIQLDQSYVKHMFSKKSCTMCFLSFIFMLGTSVYLWCSNFLVTDFSCEVKLPFVNETSKLFSCDVSPLIYMFGGMVFQIILLLLIFLLSLYNTFWCHFTKKRFELFHGEEGYDRYKCLPGFEDFLFCVALLKNNFPNGTFTFNAIKYVVNLPFEIGFNADVPVLQFVKMTQEKDPDIAKKLEKNIQMFDECVRVVRIMAYELGLNEIPNKQNASHLYCCLTYLYNTLNSTKPQISEKCIRKLITEELCKNIAYFKLYLDARDFFKPEKNNNNAASLEKVKKLINDISDESIWGDWVIIAVIANLLKIRIFLINAGKTFSDSAGYIPDVFEPYECQEFESTHFITFFAPHYYHCTKISQTATIQNHELRNSYESYSNERNQLKFQAIREVCKSNKLKLDDIVMPKLLNTQHFTKRGAMINNSLPKCNLKAPKSGVIIFNSDFDDNSIYGYSDADNLLETTSALLHEKFPHENDLNKTSSQLDKPKFFIHDSSSKSQIL